MKALLPVYCRILGYAILLLSIFVPFGLVMYGMITDANLLLYKEVIKLFMIVGLLMVLLAYTKNENAEAEKIRINAMRNALWVTIAYVLISMLVRLYNGNISSPDTSSFIIFMAINVICLEYGIKKAKIDKFFKR